MQLNMYFVFHQRKVTREMPGQVLVIFISEKPYSFIWILMIEEY